MDNLDQVQTLPLTSKSEFSDNHVSEDNRHQQQHQQHQQHQRQQQGGPRCRFKQAASAGGPRLLAASCLLLLLAVITIAALLVAMTTRRCATAEDAGGGDSSSRQKLQPMPPTASGPATAAATTFNDTDGQPCAHQEIRLPRRVAPLHYRLVMRPVLQSHWDPPDYLSMNYGRVDMELNCTEASDSVIFHVGEEQNITRLEVASMSAGAPPLRVVSRSGCPGLSQLHIGLSRRCQPGERLNVSVSYSCPINNRLDGFYLGGYKDRQKIGRFLASTHMEPISARKAFPCFDEPDMKATFSMEIIRDSSHQSLFNMPLESTIQDSSCDHLASNNSSCYRDVFQKSEIMSTYLVAYAILPLDYVSLQKQVKTSRGAIQVGIWAPSHSKDELEFAMNVTEKVLPYFEELFNLSYPLPKLDMIGVPEFSAGAMENWGLIIYRFWTLLYNPAYTPTMEKQQVAEVISHEIAHQWFGNIVTMKWWDDLWLNEAFAVFTQFMGVEAFKPSWDVMDRCYVDFVAAAMHTDSTFHSHPIIMAGISDPNEIESLFDDISYHKGSSLIRMLEGIIGRRVLKEGLIIYLNRFAWRNAASRDLFAAFSEAYVRINRNSGPHANSPAQNLTRVMDTWTTQVNYPLVTVSIRGNRLHFKQERFLLYPDASKIWESQGTAYGFKWIIPILYTTDMLTEPRWTWMDLEAETTVVLDHQPQFVKINVNQTGLYRCSYEFSNWQQLIRLSREGYFGSTDLAGLLNDAFTLAYTGRLNISVPFDLFETLEDDRLTSGAPWTIAMRKISEIAGLIASDQESEGHLSKFILKVLRKPLERILNKSEAMMTHTDKIKRQTLNQIALMVEEPSVVELYQAKYRKWRENQSIILLPDEIELVYQIGVSRGSVSDWEFFWNKYTNDVSSFYEKRHVVSALTVSNDLNVVNRLMQILLDSRQIRMQDTITIAAKLAGRGGTQDMLWTHFERNWDLVTSRYGSVAFLMSEITKFPAVCHTEYDYQRLRDFFETRPLYSGKRNANQCLEQIRANIAWIKYNMESFKTFIRRKVASLA